MESEHRKIELQSPADLTYLTSRIRATALQKLNQSVPDQTTNAAEPDQYRAKVEELVDAFIAQVLSGMRANISINGLDVVSEGAEVEKEGQSVVEVEEFEPFDERLKGRLAETTRRRDALIAKISMHRRTTPALAAKAYVAQFEREEEVAEGARTARERAAMEVDGGGLAGVEALVRGEDVSRNWERAVEGLGKLQGPGGLGETRAKLERCGEVVEYMEGKKMSV